MSTLNHNTADTHPIHGSINTTTVAKGIASPSRDDKLLPSENNNSLPSQHNISLPSQNITIQSSANNNTSNPTHIQPSSLPSHGNITPSILKNPTTINKTRIKNVPANVKIRNIPENVKDWDEMTLAERLEAATDLPLTPFSRYECKIENELPYLSPWPPRQQCKN